MVIVLGVVMLNRLRLSEICSERLLVCCDKCGLVSNLSVSALIGSYGDIPFDPLKIALAQRCSCAGSNERVRECGMYFRNVEHQTAA